MGGRWKCDKGCVYPDDDPQGRAGQPMIHHRLAECKYERAYKPPKAETEPPAKKPAAAPPKEEGFWHGVGVRFRSSKVVNTVKGGARAVAQDQPIDFVVDAPHTIQAWNMVLGGFWYVIAGVDRFWFKSKNHLPKKQFRLSDGAMEVQIPTNPRNFYSRIVTRATILLGAKKASDAHAMIDSASFVTGFAGLGWAIYAHWDWLSKHSPEYLKAKEKKQAERAVRKGEWFRAKEGPATVPRDDVVGEVRALVPAAA